MKQNKMKNELPSSDYNLEKETNYKVIDIDMQEFDIGYSGLESIDDIDKKTYSYIENMIRSSFEYKQYITYLKQELDITQCALTPALDIKELDIGLEFHHYPFSLYDIAETVLNKHMTNKKQNEKVSFFDVMDEVMKIHYEGNIGLIPLTTTMHVMAHNDALKIPVECIYGNYNKFYLDYKKFMSPDLLDKYQTRMSIDTSDALEFNKKMLEVSPLHYNVTYNKKVDADNEDSYKDED